MRLARGERNLVDLVDEDDAVRLHPLERLAHDALLVHELLGLLLREEPSGFGNAELALLGFLPERQVAEHLLQIEPHLLHALAAEDLHRRRRALLHLHLDLALVEAARVQHAAQFLARAVAGAGQQKIQQAFFGQLLGAWLHVLRPLLADQRDALLDQIADHRVDVLSDVPDFGELRSLHFHEGRARQPRQPPRDLGLADAGRPDEDDVLG